MASAKPGDVTSKPINIRFVIWYDSIQNLDFDLKWIIADDADRNGFDMTKQITKERTTKLSRVGTSATARRIGSINNRSPACTRLRDIVSTPPARHEPQPQQPKEVKAKKVKLPKTKGKEGYKH